MLNIIWLARRSLGLKVYAPADVMGALLNGSADERFVLARLFGDYDPDPTRDYGDEAIKRLAAKRLEHGKGRYYWPVRVTDNNKEAITAVHKALPLLKMLKLDDDLDLDDEEQELFKAFAELLKD